MAAAPVKNQGLAEAGCNYVAQDEIWKDHINQEVKTCKKWPKDWAFLTTSFKELVKDEFPDAKTRKDVRLPPISSAEPCVRVHPSPIPVPRTSANMIGWRSSNPQFNLERYGGYAKPKGGLVKQLKWPTEGID